MLEQLRFLAWPLVLMLLATLAYTTRVQYEMPDFEVYHTAATRVLQGQSPYQTTDARPFTYMPAVAIAMTPFAMVDHDAAKFLWFALSVGLLTAFVRWAVHGLPERRRPEQALQWLTVALMLPFYAHELTLGQANVLLGVLLMGSLLAAQVDLTRTAGVMLGIAIFIKPYSLLLLPWLAFAHGARAAMATTMVVAGGLILPALVFGWSGNVQMLVSWFLTVSDSPLGPVRLDETVSIGAMWVKWFGLNRFATVLMVLSTTAVLGLVTTVWVHRRTVFSPDYLEFALLMLLIPLLSSRGSEYLLLLATPAVICLLDRWGEVSRRWQVVTGAALLTMSLAALDVLGPDVRGWLAGSAVITVAALAAVVAAAHLRWRALA